MRIGFQRRKNSHSSVLIVHFEACTPTSAKKDSRQWNRLLQCIEREGVGAQAQTDEPYLGRACVRSPSTPICPGALARLSSFQLWKHILLSTSKPTVPHICQCIHTHTHTLILCAVNKKNIKKQSVQKHRYALFAPNLLHTFIKAQALPTQYSHRESGTLCPFIYRALRF